MEKPAPDDLKERRLTIEDDVSQRGIDHTAGDGVGPLDDQDPFDDGVGTGEDVDEEALAAAIASAVAEAQDLQAEVDALLLAIEDMAEDINCMHVVGNCSEGTGILTIGLSLDPPDGETAEDCDGLHTFQTTNPCRCCLDAPAIAYDCAHLRAQKRLCGWPGFDAPQRRFSTLGLTSFELGVASMGFDVTKHQEGNASRNVTEVEGICSPGDSLSLELTEWAARCDPGEVSYDTHEPFSGVFFDPCRLICGWNFDGPTAFPRYATAEISGDDKILASGSNDLVRHHLSETTANARLRVELGSNWESCGSGATSFELEVEDTAVRCGQAAVTYSCTGERGTKTICGVPALDGSEPGVLYGGIALSGAVWTTHGSADKAYLHLASGSVSFGLDMGSCAKTGDLSIEKRLATFSCVNTCIGSESGPWTKGGEYECAASVSGNNWSWPTPGNTAHISTAAEMADPPEPCQLSFTLTVDGADAVTLTRDGSGTFVRGDGTLFRVYGVDEGGGIYAYYIENQDEAPSSCCQDQVDYSVISTDDFCLRDLPGDFSEITESSATAGVLTPASPQGPANYACTGDCVGSSVAYGGGMISVSLTDRKEWQDGEGTVTDLGTLAECVFGVTQISGGGTGCCGTEACQIDVSAQQIELEIQASALLVGETYEVTITYQGCEIATNGTGDVSGGLVSGGLCDESGEAPTISTETITFVAESDTETIFHTPDLPTEGLTLQVSNVEIEATSVPNECFEDVIDSETRLFDPMGTPTGYTATVDSQTQRTLSLSGSLLAEPLSFDCGVCGDWEPSQATDGDYTISLSSPADLDDGIELDFVPSAIRDLYLYTLTVSFSGDVELRYHTSYQSGLVARRRRRRIFFYLSGSGQYYVVVTYSRTIGGVTTEHEITGIVNAGQSYPANNPANGHYIDLPPPELGETLAYVSHKAAPYPLSSAGCELVMVGDAEMLEFLREPSGYTLAAQSELLADVTLDAGRLQDVSIDCGSGDCQDNTGNDYCDDIACGSISYDSPDEGFQLALSGELDFHNSGESLQTFSSGTDLNCIAGVTQVTETNEYTQGGESVYLAANVTGQSIEITITASSLYVGMEYAITIFYAVCEIATNTTGDVSGGLLDMSGDCAESGSPPVSEEETITFEAEDTTEEIVHLVDMPPEGKTRKVIGITIAYAS